MNAFEAIETRKTIRDFNDKRIPGEVVESIVNAGLKAPSNDHMRKWEFIVINEEKYKIDLRCNQKYGCIS